ncbi:FecCD family ABC transporter permease [Agaribacterium haliotis]|uniref:FecCD family ABC transporter permease n=1 Tax=Agaribacterium haliotis TaxID=2013869 RepID=UPI000BB57D57|nr:iron ABC transporter permease [Agaribacterium haliotis]
MNIKLGINHRHRQLAFALAALLTCCCFFALANGPLQINFQQLFDVVSSGFSQPQAELRMQHYVVWDIRLPRLICSLAVGAGLALAGCCMQALFRNPLADPALIGVSSGAAFGAVFVIVFSASFASSLSVASHFLLPLAAFLSGAITAMCVVAIATYRGQSNAALMLLAGVAMNAIAAAGIALLTYAADDNQLRDLSFWSMGSVAKATWPELAVAVPLIVASSVMLLRHRSALNALLLGEQVALHIGHDVKKIKRSIVVHATIIVGSAVAISGVIMFIGLVVPHLIRLICGPDHKKLLPLSMLLGASLLTLADLAARQLIAPAELPIGVLMSVVGGPFFIVLLLRQRKQLLFQS